MSLKILLGVTTREIICQPSIFRQYYDVSDFLFLFSFYSADKDTNKKGSNGVPAFARMTLRPTPNAQKVKENEVSDNRGQNAYRHVLC